LFFGFGGGLLWGLRLGLGLLCHGLRFRFRLFAVGRGRRVILAVPPRAEAAREIPAGRRHHHLFDLRKHAGREPSNAALSASETTCLWLIFGPRELSKFHRLPAGLAVQGSGGECDGRGASGRSMKDRTSLQTVSA